MMDGGMAEQAPQMPLDAGPLRRRPARPLVALVTIALAAAATSGPPTPPVPLPERVRIVRMRLVDAVSAKLATRASRRRSRVRLASPEIGTTPPSRSDTPALPTVGRPRDCPC